MKKKKDLLGVSGINEENSGVSIFADFNSTEEVFTVNEEIELPILPLRNMFIFPTTLLPVPVGRKSSLDLVKYAERKKEYIAIFTQRNARVEVPDNAKDLYETGVIAKVVRIFELPEENTTVLIQGIQRVKIKSVDSKKPFLRGSVIPLTDISPKAGDDEYKALIDECRSSANKLVTFSEGLYPEIKLSLKEIANPQILINFLCLNMRITVKEKHQLLCEESLKERAYHLATIMNREIKILQLRQEIASRTNEDLDQQQREYYLQQQMKVIQEELGSTIDQEIAELRRKAEDKKWSQKIKEVFDKELAKLERINSQTPDYHVQLNYLQTFISLPWGECSTDHLDINNAQKVLDKDHYGLEKVKERILEHLAVIKMRGDLKSPILCLYGPPGVGKTSLGRSIAEALKREYVRVSLGGVHDESEIRGHRRTYVGAMPGRIIKNLIKAGTDNPVFILDEIDKVGGNSLHGDPSSALLEVLDPEQNSTFHDNFLDVDYDLSKVMFIATANNLGSIPAPLLDRMELIEVSGYLTEEKIEIARRHLVAKEKEANGISDEKITIRKPALEKIIEEYTRESGVRELEKKIGKICRRIACQKAATGAVETPIIGVEHLKDLLGPKKYSRDKYQGNDYAGVVTGLAWTAVGGEILFIETSLSRGKGDKLTLTGNLGDVMKESAMLALEYTKSHAHLYDIPTEAFENWNIHVHVPEGAIPKDGPSAGITMVTALVSAYTQRKVKKNLAMTGEITLRGKVLPVGGIKEKILAAKRAGMKEIILCSENRRDIEVIPEKYLDGVTFHYVDDITEVLDIALTDEKVKNPIKFTAEA